MHKNTLLITALCVAAATSSFAQQQRWKPIYGGKHGLNATTRNILQRQQPVTANKGTAQADRLIGWSIYQQNQLADSAWYKYIGPSHGSTLDNIVLNSYMDFGYDPISRPVMPYPMDVSRNAPSLKYDSAYNLINFSPGGTDRSESRISRSYSNNMLSTQLINSTIFYSGNTYPNKAKQLFGYNGSGNLVSASYYNDTSTALSGMFELLGTQYYTYDGNNHVVRDSLVDNSTGTVLPAENIRYAYDASGNLVNATHYTYNGTWVADGQDVYVYTAANKMTTHISKVDNGSGTLVNDVLDSFVYQGNLITYNSDYTWDDASGIWTDGYATRNYYNAQSNLDSQIGGYLNGTAFVYDSKTTYTYNAFGHFDKLKAYSPSGSGTGFNTTPDAVFNMYYEVYDPASVKRVATADLGASIFPNPAGDVLHIRLKDGASGAIGLRIYNTAGQILQATTLSSTLDAVPVSSLPAGQYVLEVSNAAGAQRLPFVKL